MDSPAAAMDSPAVIHLSFNQDGGCFAAATTAGFSVFTTDPYSPSILRPFPSAISAAHMLFRTNIFALVAPHKVTIWDDHRSRSLGHLSFRSEVISVRLRRDRIVVVLMQKIYVYNFADLKLVHQIETDENPRGLCEVSQSGAMVLVCMGLRKGQVRVEHSQLKRSRLVMAHDSGVACVALTNDGRLVATASVKGTLVRLFNALDGTLLQELRRGFEKAEIYCLSFSLTAQWLAVSSDKGTVHVFSLKADSTSLENSKSWEEEPNSLVRASVSRISFIKGVLPKYFSSQGSLAQFRLQEGLQHIVAFQKNTVLIIGVDGRFYRCEFDPVAGGEMTQLECHNFLQPQASSE